MNVLAFALGVISLGLVEADVSHLRQNQQQSRGHATYVANNGQFVKQSFNPNGDASFSSQSYNNAAGNEPNSKSRYWWMNTDSPFTKTHNTQQNNYISAAGCNGCASRTLNIKHNTQQQHFTQQNSAYSQNPFTNVKSNGIYRQSASVSGSPNFFAQQSSSSFDSGRIQQSSACADSNSACVAPKFCFNGFIDQSATQKATRSAVSLSSAFVQTNFCVSDIRHHHLPTGKNKASAFS
jgi:hypothetical protein